jgi:exosortase/archaeosortase family protein
MNALWATVAVAAACWHAWRALALRIDSPAAALPLLLVMAALALPLMKRGSPRHAVPVVPLGLLLAAYGVTVLIAPPIFSCAWALLAICYCLHAASHAQAPRSPFWGLVLLALPVLPTLEFYTAYPVRLAAIEATASLLRMNGVSVEVVGLALRFGERLIQFDAPCSGVRMLWTCWFLASALAHLHRFDAWRHAAALLASTLLAVAGNILRATSLFYVEAGLLHFEAWPWLHEGVGLVSFAMTALLVFFAIGWRAKGAAR